MTLTTSEKTAVDAALLHAASQQMITRAVEEAWPDKDVVLGPQCPSVTSYVCRVTVDGEEVIAKYSWLGMSLVSILRGAGGTWEEVQEAQRTYVESSDLLTGREARNLDFLRKLGRPRVCGTAGLHRGVLLTRIVPGRPLADELASRPRETGALLGAVLGALGELHRPGGAECLREAAPIGERSVVGVFRRKFNGPSTSAYLRSLGQDCGLQEHERQEVIDLMRTAVRRLLRMAGSISSSQDAVVFGDLKPEHVFLDGPSLTFIDPAVQWAAGPEPDIAKLTGRTLLLAVGHPEPRAGREIVQGVASTLARHIAGLPEYERSARLREVLVLWLMDTVSILSTCLSAPPGLPLAPHQQALVAQARTVAGVVDRVGAFLVGSMAGSRLLEAVFSEVEHTAGSPR
ncbi:phosphotransferase [Streptomyces sp. NPDC048332]|uniref:phosphotransferase n=1 Tax=Streptomyces sp. NPDC048332 TaxID=3154619 RepID=UPI003442155D